MRDCGSWLVFGRAFRFIVQVEQRRRGKLEERERCWNEFRAGTIDAPSRADFESFWERQDGVRSVIVIDTLSAVPAASQYKEYGRALEWGWPAGVGWRPLDLFQSHYLMNVCGVEEATVSFYLGAMLR